MTRLILASLMLAISISSIVRPKQQPSHGSIWLYDRHKNHQTATRRLYGGHEADDLNLWTMLIWLMLIHNGHCYRSTSCHPNQPIKFLQGRNGRPGKDLTRMPCVNPTVTACD
jgi:hypothetical protein